MKENNLENILSQYDESIQLYNDFSSKTELLLNSFVKDELNPHQIKFRIKDRNSLTQKIIKKNYKYSNLNEITDILGFRIVLYFEDDIDTIEEIIKTEFKIDIDNSIDKRTLEVDRFGYRSLHYVVSLHEERLKLREYKNFKDLKFEIQVRSILQHSWAEIEHDIGYKGANEIPHSAKRTFYRVAALLEQADIEFTKLRQEIIEFEKQISQDLATKQSSIKLDASSLIAFIKNSKLLKEIEKKIEIELNCPLSSDNDISNEFISPEFINDLKIAGITDIVELEKSLDKNQNLIIDKQKIFVETLKESKIWNRLTFSKGAPVIWLRDWLKENQTL